MAERIRIKFKDGSHHTFTHNPRPGGSYSLTVRYEGEFAIVKDEWGAETAFPVADIEEVYSEPSYR